MKKVYVVYYFETGNEEGTMFQADFETSEAADAFITGTGTGIEVFDTKEEYKEVNTEKKTEPKFNKGNMIIHKDHANYSHASIYSGPFEVKDISGKDYILAQPNFYGNRDIVTVDGSFERYRTIINRIDGEYQVKERNGEIYFTTDKQDAIDTAKFIHGEGVQIIIKNR
jgi:hypothetical protein